MTPEVTAAVVAIGESLLIGFLIGAQREASKEQGHPGVRDFVLVALAGAVCGLLNSPSFAAAMLLSITALLGIFYVRGHERSGVTTELAAVATYALGFLTTTPQSRLAIGTAIVVVGFLEFKRGLHRLVRETITEAEFNDTLRFLAIIFIVYPLLPEGRFGPYEFLSPRQIWAFVILVSSVSYAGYFLAKFMGPGRGLRLAGVLGGLASTTAATASFARNSSEEPDNRALYSQAAIIANAVQFPRMLLILFVASPSLARASLVPMVGMMAAGLVTALLVSRPGSTDTGASSPAVHNPFRLAPALKFGALFGAILFASKAASAVFGSSAIYWTSALGGSLDTDAVSLSLADLLEHGTIPVSVAVAGVLLAWLSNAVVKTAIAAYAGGSFYARRVATGFAVMFAVGFPLWYLTRAQ